MSAGDDRARMSAGDDRARMSAGDHTARTSAGDDLDLAALVAEVRRAGLPVTTDSLLTLTRAVAALAPSGRSDVYWAGRATLAPAPDRIPTYDAAFARWCAGTEPDAPPADEPDRRLVPPPTIPARASAREVLRHRDFAPGDEAELAQLAALLPSIAAPAHRRSRRHRAGRRRRGPLDLRRTARAATATGGEVVRRHHRERTVRPRPLVLLVDISGSMEPYGRPVLRFAHAAVQVRPRVEVFALATRVTRLTAALAVRDPDRALAAVGAAAPDWSGGTRLGAGLATFTRTWGARGMARGADVVVVSDGLERGDPELIGREVARLHRLAHRLLWVNPLAGTEGYRPVARGMAAALPHVDALLPGHDLASLEHLVTALADDGGRRR